MAVSARGYKDGDDWKTVPSQNQWQELYAYQEAFGVRLVRLNAWPSAEYGVQSTGGVVSADQPVGVFAFRRAHWDWANNIDRSLLYQ